MVTIVTVVNVVIGEFIWKDLLDNWLMSDYSHLSDYIVRLQHCRLYLMQNRMVYAPFRFKDVCMYVFKECMYVFKEIVIIFCYDYKFY